MRSAANPSAARPSADSRRGLRDTRDVVRDRLAFPRSPGPLIAMILAGGCVALFDLASKGIHTVGGIPRGLAVPTLPSLTGIDIVSLLPTALGVALVAAVLHGFPVSSRNHVTIGLDKNAATQPIRSCAATIGARTAS